MLRKHSSGSMLRSIFRRTVYQKTRLGIKVPTSSLFFGSIAGRVFFLVQGLDMVATPFEFVDTGHRVGQRAGVMSRLRDSL
jgi:hypothetical protein